MKQKTIWYMPRHCVFNPKKPEKLIMDFDCAARYQGVSFNCAILSGLDVTSSLLHFLLRFRVHPIAVAAGIEEMFSQVRVPKADQDALRILWHPESQLQDDPEVYRIRVHPFDVTSSLFCTTFTLRKSDKRFRQFYCSVVLQAVLRNFHVDDCLASFPDEDSTLTFVRGLIDCREQQLTDESLITTKTGIQRTFNARPFVPVVSDDINSAALISKDLMLLISNVESDIKETLLDRYKVKWEQVTYIAGVFWKQWIKYYLSTLQWRQKSFVQIRNNKAIDIMLITNESHQKGSCPLGIFIVIPTNEYERVRTSEFVRDVRNICLLKGASINKGGDDTYNKMSGVVS